MSTTIIDGRGNYITGGSEYIAGVTQDHKLMVDATVSATVATDYKISGTHTGIGSASLVAGDYGGSVWPLRIFGGSYVMVAGSISSMPSVTATNSANYAISGLLSDAGSLTLIGAERAGSVYPIRLDLGSYLMVAGSISSMPTISVTTGSESYIKAGSIEVWTGSIYSRGIGSIRIAEQGLDLSIANPATIGSYTTQTISGVISNRVAGSIVDWPGIISGVGVFTIVSGGQAIPVASSVDGASQPNALFVHSFGKGFNGTTWDRLRADSGTNIGIGV